MDTDHRNETLLHVKFVTKQEKFAVPDTVYYVPANITRFGLNDLLNELINENVDNENRKKGSFDFIIDGELLRSKLSEHIFERHISSENEICIEYIEATSPPKPKDCLQHDDWVSAVHSTDEWILSGCYDNSLHIWSAKGKHLLSNFIHSAPIKDVSWISFNSSLSTFVSVSQDQTAIIWEWNVQKNFMRPLFICRGHERSINCVDAKSLNFVTGGWDCNVKFWSADTNVSSEDVEEEEQPLKKKAKLSGTDVVPTRVPKSTFQGHKEAITDIQWTNTDEIMSGSWDHTIKLWDVEYGGIKSEIIVNKPVFSCHYSVNNSLILVSNPDRHIRLYDSRSDGNSVVKKAFTSHNAWVQTVKWSPTDSNIFVSGSYDHCLKLWDIRSGNTPLYDLFGHESKILCCDWSKPDTIISGSCDNTLRLFTIKTQQSVSS